MNKESVSAAVIGISAGSLAKAIRDGALSSVEVVDAHISRIEACEPALNAMAVPLFDEARRAARQADDARSRGEPMGPLHGVPMTVKGQFRVAGCETTMGLPRFKGRVDQEDGPLIARLRRAGAIILGKTNIMQLLMGYESDNPLYGRTSNPWNVERTSGGSSGGEAALLSSGGSPLGLGGDLGGSIRVPAHFCGIHGLKPTARRLPLDDTPAEDFFPLGQDAIIAQTGPMARTVEDLALAMSILAGPYDEHLLDRVPPVPWPSEMAVDVGKMTIGVIEDNGLMAPSPALRRAVREAATHLLERGARVVEFVPPDPAEGVGLFLDILLADGGRTMKQALGSDAANSLLKPVLQGATTPRAMRPLVSALLSRAGQATAAWIVRHGGARPAHEYWALVARCDAFRNRFLTAMEDAGVDVLLCPPYATAAPPHGATADLLGAASYAIQFNVTGMPAGVVAATRVREGEEGDRPASRDKAARAATRSDRGSAGLPVGVQVSAAPWREDMVLAVMAALEQRFRDSSDYPGMAAV